jgi:hypothetical protein
MKGIPVSFLKEIVMRVRIWVRLAILALLLGSDLLRAEEPLQLCKRLEDYPQEMRKSVIRLENHVNRLDIPIDKKNELKNYGLEHIYKNRARLKNNGIDSFDPRRCISRAWREPYFKAPGASTTHESLEDYAVEEDDAGRIFLRIRGHGYMPLPLTREDLDDYTQRLDRAERDDPEKLGTILADAARRYSDQEEILTPFRDRWPKTCASADAQLNDLKSYPEGKDKEKAIGTLTKAKYRISKQWAWAGFAVLAVIIAFRTRRNNGKVDLGGLPKSPPGEPQSDPRSESKTSDASNPEKSKELVLIPRHPTS